MSGVFLALLCAQVIAFGAFIAEIMYRRYKRAYSSVTAVALQKPSMRFVPKRLQR